ncbi:MAG: hypothetical protein ACXVZM_03070 [Terriglobales bacterium]
MRALAGIVTLICAAVWAQTVAPGPNTKTPGLALLQECAQKRTPAACEVSTRELKHAQRDFARGLKLQKSGKADQAFEAIDSAANLVPRDLEYATAREVLRQKIVYDHIQRGNALLLQQKETAAAGEFREALHLDPSNTFALQRMQDATPLPVAPRVPGIRMVDDPGELRLQPATDLRGTFHFRGDTRALYEAIATTFGVTPRFDESVTPRQVRFDLQNVDFATAMRLAGVMTKTFWTPLSAREFLVVADSPQNRLQFERMALRSFYIPDVTSQQELSDLVNLLRTIFNVRFVTLQTGTSTMVVRASHTVLDAATMLLESLDSSRPQVMLDFQVFQISRTMMRSFGLSMPLQWQTFNVSSQALAALSQPNVQNLINQLISSGGINQANTTAISALLAQLQSQSQNPLLQQPFATFGGGQTLTAVPFPPTSISFSHNESLVTTIQKLTLRASSGNAAMLRIGDRYPILNATFAPIFNTPSIAQVIQNQSFIAPFPSFNYEDLGLSVKATPQIHADGEVQMALNVEIRALGGQSFNGVPVITNRMYTGSITIRDGESGVVAGMIDFSEQTSLTGLPGIARLPVLGTLTSAHNKQKTDTELLVIITPHIMRTREQAPKLITLPEG